VSGDLLFIASLFSLAVSRRDIRQHEQVQTTEKQKKNGTGDE
jgi:hypothetical protein